MSRLKDYVIAIIIGGLTGLIFPIIAFWIINKRLVEKKKGGD